MSVVAVAAEIVAEASNAQGAYAAAGFCLVHGRAELVGRGSTPMTISAALRLIEQIARPLSTTEA